MGSRFSFALYACLLLLFGSCTATRETTAPPPAFPQVELAKPRNVIFLIGDGMGLPQITGAMYMNNNISVFERFKNIGFHKSNSSDN
ncbi:MAG: alkaline phosphatase, partial [Saprospiraceae bacterium]|nr:alkaline phosphatase [Saprospiraceae bacterium]